MDFERYDPGAELRELQELVDDGRYGDVLEHLAAIDPAGLDEAGRGGLGGLQLVCLTELDREAEAEAVLDGLFSEGNAQSVLCAGIECSERGYYGLAERILRRAAELRPESANPPYNLALVLHRDERYEEALEWAERAAALGDWAPLHFQQGESLRALGRLEEAAVSFRRYLAAVPDDPLAWHILANLESDRGRFSEAFEAYDRALRLDPDASEVHYNKAIAAARSEDRARLRESVEALHGLEPGSWRALAAAAILAEEEGNLEHALELRRDALDATLFQEGEEELSPDLPYVVATALQFAERNGLPEERDNLLDRAFSLGLFYPDVLEVARRTHGRLSSQARLFRVLVEARAEDPEFVDQCREFYGEYDGRYGYICPYRVWADSADEARAVALEFEVEHGAGSDAEVTETEELSGPDEEHIGVSWRGEMHVFRVEEEDD